MLHIVGVKLFFFAEQKWWKARHGPLPPFLRILHLLLGSPPLFIVFAHSSSSRLIALKLFLTYLLFLKVHNRTHTLFNIIQNSNRFSQELNFRANFLTTNHIQLIFRIACLRYVKLILFFQPAMIAQTNKAVN